MSAYPDHRTWMLDRYGPRWCVASRLTQRLRDKGYTVALSSQRYEREQRQWALAHPAYLIVAALPDGPHKDMIGRAVLREIGVRAYG